MARQNRKSRRITIQDVAAHAGVSTGTVSNVLNDRNGAVGIDTRDRVLSVIEQLGYVRNRNAQSLSSLKTHCIGLYIGDIEDPIFPSVLKSLTRIAESKGYTIFANDTSGSVDGWSRDSVLDHVLARRFDGLLLMTPDVTKDVVQHIIQSEIDVVAVDSLELSDIVPNIYFDRACAIDLAVDHLRSLGHSEIGLLQIPKATLLVERDEALPVRSYFRRVLQTHGLAYQPSYVYDGWFSVESGEVCARKILKQRTRPTALFALNDLMAIGVMKTLLAAGMRIPDDIAVMGIDDISFSRLMTPGLTTLRVPTEQIADIAFEMLAGGTYKGGPVVAGNYVVSPTLVVRGSTDRMLG